MERIALRKGIEVLVPVPQGYRTFTLDEYPDHGMETYFLLRGSNRAFRSVEEAKTVLTDNLKNGIDPYLGPEPSMAPDENPTNPGLPAHIGRVEAGPNAYQDQDVERILQDLQETLSEIVNNPQIDKAVIDHAKKALSSCIALLEKDQ